MTDNLFVQYFIKGGWIMWPILMTSVVAVAIVLNRVIWWSLERRKHDPDKLDKVYASIQKGDIKAAADLAKTSQDPILRVVGNGLNNHHASMDGALQVAAGYEMERAGRFIVVLDTIVTLAPLLGLLGTVTGLMKAFFKLGSTELSEEAISGGIAEALIATACGLTIAVMSLVFLNYFAARVSKLQFEIQTACTNVEVLFKSLAKKKNPVESPVAAVA
jgi:biopolymer transport protein ExbB